MRRPAHRPHLFGYRIDKAGGRMQVDGTVSGELRPID